MVIMQIIITDISAGKLKLLLCRAGWNQRNTSAWVSPSTTSPDMNENWRVHRSGLSFVLTSWNNLWNEVNPPSLVGINSHIIPFILKECESWIWFQIPQMHGRGTGEGLANLFSSQKFGFKVAHHCLHHCLHLCLLGSKSCTGCQPLWTQKELQRFHQNPTEKPELNFNNCAVKGHWISMFLKVK